MVEAKRTPTWTDHAEDQLLKRASRIRDLEERQILPEIRRIEVIGQYLQRRRDRDSSSLINK